MNLTKAIGIFLAIAMLAPIQMHAASESPDRLTGPSDQIDIPDEDCFYGIAHSVYDGNGQFEHCYIVIKNASGQVVDQWEVGLPWVNSSDCESYIDEHGINTGPSGCAVPWESIIWYCSDNHYPGCHTMGCHAGLFGGPRDYR